METLGLADSTPRTESRLKSLFWPSISTGSDVDYLGVQGYWVCTAAAGLSCVVLIISGQPVVAVFISLFYFLGGVGVRERSPYAASVVLAMFLLNVITSGPGVLNILITALLLSNLRATWAAAHWKPESEEATLPPRLNETWGDKFADQLPAWLWPKLRIVYYLFSGCFLLLTVVGLVTIYLRPLR